MILSPYKGQVEHIQARLSRDVRCSEEEREAIEVNTVDGSQGRYGRWPVRASEFVPCACIRTLHQTVCVPRLKQGDLS